MIWFWCVSWGWWWPLKGGQWWTLTLLFLCLLCVSGWRWSGSKLCAQLSGSHRTQHSWLLSAATLQPWRATHYWEPLHWKYEVTSCIFCRMQHHHSAPCLQTAVLYLTVSTSTVDHCHSSLIEAKVCPSVKVMFLAEPDLLTWKFRFVPPS